jgi:hypothetical protein
MASDDQDVYSETFSELTDEGNMAEHLPVIDTTWWQTTFDENWTNMMLAQSYANFKKQAIDDVNQLQMSLAQQADMLFLMKEHHTKGTNYQRCFYALSCMKIRLGDVQKHLLNNGVMDDVLLASLQTAKDLKTTLGLTRTQKVVVHQGRFFSTTGKSDMLLMVLTNIADKIERKMQWINERYPRKMDDDVCSTDEARQAEQARRTVCGV